MSRLFYAFHYESGLHTTYASNPSKTAGFVRAYATKALRDEACNDYVSSFFSFGKKVLPVRAVTVREIRAMGHSKSLDDRTDEGACLKSHVVGIDIDQNGNYLDDSYRGYFADQYGTVYEKCESSNIAVGKLNGEPLAEWVDDYLENYF